MNRLQVMRVDVYAAVGLLIWVFVLKSGVHATLAGVLTALAIPARDPQGGSPLQRIEHSLHPWVVFMILPVFGFFNAGVDLSGARPAALLDPITLGITLGLVVGKAVGVFGSAWLILRSGLAMAPTGASMVQLFGVCVLCGIGFTMSLFIGGLAFAGYDAGYETKLKLGVLAGSLVAGVLGAAVLIATGRVSARPPSTSAP
jgi:NhaA family Na+:H+ antiporter